MAHAIRHWLKGFELHPAPLLYEVPESAATGIPDSANETQASSFTRERWGEKPNISAEDFISSDDSSHLQHRHHPRHPAFAGQEKDIITEDSPNKHAMASAPFEGDFETGLMPSSSEINLPSNQSPGLQRRLSQFHIQMIAFGGSIGTGLYIGSGSVYASGGPGFLLIDYCLIGSMLYCVVMCLGELAVIFPVSGSFATYSSRFISPTWGFAMGWNCAFHVSPTSISSLANTDFWWSVWLCFVFPLPSSEFLLADWAHGGEQIGCNGSLHCLSSWSPLPSSLASGILTRQSAQGCG